MREHSNRTGEVAVVLNKDQVTNLDQIAIDIRRATGYAISRSAMIRAILSAVLKYHQRWPACESEQDLQNAIETQLVRGIIR